MKRRTFWGLFSGCLLSLLLAAPAAAAVVGTRHYDISVEGGMDPADVGNMLEQLYSRLQTYFGTEPPGRLAIGIYATREQWARALQADGQWVPPQAGGYYAPQTRKAYLWLQPTPYFTRQLILHEATHQFHWLTSTGNRDPNATWYTEGLAEYFGMHNWDGRRLETGVIPAMTLEDYPATAIKDFESVGGDLDRIFSFVSRPASWAMVHFLIANYPEQFRAFSRRLDRGEDSSAAFRKVFGSDLAKFSGPCRAWIRDHAQPWEIVWTSWQQRGESMESDSSSVALTVMKTVCPTLTVELQSLSRGGTAGLVFGYRSPEDFYMFQVQSTSQVAVYHRQNGSWNKLLTKDYKPSDGLNVLSMAQDEKSTYLRINGQEMGDISVIGRMGLNSNGCRASFKVR